MQLVRMIRPAAAVLGGLLATSAASPIAAANAPASAIASTQCADRGCLIRLADAYLDAVVGHDPTRLPFAPDVKFTENGISLKPGQALWGTASVAGTNRIYVADPGSGQVGVYASVKEHGDAALLSVRLKTVDGLITEAETIVTRRFPQGAGAPSLAEMDIQEAPVFNAVVPPAERSSPDKMIAAADSYFVGMVDRQVMPSFSSDCFRYEAGMKTANAPNMPADDWRGWSCGKQFEDNYTAAVSGEIDRRYFVDREAGLVWTQNAMQFDGKLQQITLTSGKVVPVLTGLNRPMALLASEIFKVRKDRITAIQSVMINGAFGTISGFSGGRDTWRSDPR